MIYQGVAGIGQARRGVARPGKTTQGSLLNPMNSEIVDPKEKRVIGEASVETQMIVKRLLSVEVGELATYQSLGDSIGLADIRERQGAIDTARRILIRDHQRVFGTVVNEGLKRLSDSETAKVGIPAIAHIRRTAGTAAKKIACADYEKLSNSDRITLNTQASLLGAISLVTKTSKLKQLENAVEKASCKLAVGSTLSLFAGV